MAYTINSASAPFVTAAQMVVIFDWRTLADLLTDADAGLTNSSAVQASAILAELLMEGAGKIELATSIGNRYQPSDLTLLAASSTVSGSLLRRMNADITMELCWRRRPDKEMPTMPQWEEAGKMLEALAHGEAIFGFQENMDAGLLDDHIETATEVEARNMPTYIARNLFGTRANRLTTR